MHVLAVSATLAAAAPISAEQVPVVQPGADLAELSPVEAWTADPTIVFEADEVTLEDFRWVARPIVIFADTPADPAFAQQMQEIASRPADLVRRDVVLIVDTDPSARSEVRRELRPRGFSLVLIDKDGRVALRKPMPWSTREIGRAIDKMPIRIREIREGSTLDAG